mgnify:CR=1 FL=1
MPLTLKRLGLDRVWLMVSPGNPLKSREGLPSLAARMTAARKLMRDPRIVVTGFEADIGAVYSYQTVDFLRRACPGVHFVWVMGADNLAQLHRWRDWRGIARLMPIAVIARPGYDAHAIAGPAMAWFRRFVRRPDQRHHWTKWSTPALVFLRFRPDPRSATALRRADPYWFHRYKELGTRDGVTRKLVS